MEELKKFKGVLKEMWAPTVAVVASEEAERLCLEKSGMTIAQLLQRFGSLQQLNAGIGVPVRTPAENPIRIHQWYLRFFSSKDMTPVPPHLADRHLADVLHSLAKSHTSLPVPDMPYLVSTSPTQDHTPWYLEYRNEFFRTLRYQSHETQDHPVACLFVLTSKSLQATGNDDSNDNNNSSSMALTPEELLGEAFSSLYSQSTLPFIKQAVKDGSTITHYLLLHDDQDDLQSLSLEESTSLKAQAQRALHALPSTIGPAGHVISLHSMMTAERPHDSTISRLQAMMDELAVRKIIPHVESRIRHLDQTVLAARKGLRNQLKSLLFRKSVTTNDSGIGSGGTPVTQSGSNATDGNSLYLHDASNLYPPSSPQHQLRKLADLAISVGDHETSLSTLRLLASDFKSDKAHVHYAGTQETMAIVMVIADSSPSDVIANFKEAFYRYSQGAATGGQSPDTLHKQRLPEDSKGDSQEGSRNANANALRCATRTAMLMAGYLSAIGRFQDASWIAMKAHFQEENIRAALLLELAAHLLLRTKPAKIRKFAFHLVLAGLRYSQGGERILAARSYSQVLSVYKGSKWEAVEEHVREALGKSCEELGDYIGAVEHFTATLLCPRLPASLQSLHLQQFAEALHAATKHSGHAPEIRLPLPLIDTHYIDVTCPGQESYASIEARHVDATTWTRLENSLKGSSEVSASSATTWLDSSPENADDGKDNDNDAASNAHYSCCVGEDIGIDVEVSNPLKIELAITKLRLVCLFTAPPSTSQHGSGGGKSDDSNHAQRPSAPATTATLPYQLREEKITLYPGEKALIHLRVKPIKTGHLTIHGVAWTLNGVADGKRLFELPRPVHARCKGGRSEGGGRLGKKVVMKELKYSRLHHHGNEQESEERGESREGEEAAAVITADKDGVVDDSTTSTSIINDPQEPSSSIPGTAISQKGGIEVKILPPMPRLEVSIEDMPLMMYVGQVMKCTLRMKNVGTMTLHAVRAAIDTSSVYIVDATRAEDARKQGAYVFALEDVRLSVNQERSISVYIRPHSPGPYRFNACFYYEPLVKLESLPFRTLRTTFGTSVLPSIDVRCTTLVPQKGFDAGSKLIVLRGINLQGMETFHLSEFSFFPTLSSDTILPQSQWSLSLMRKDDNEIASVTIPDSNGTININGRCIDLSMDLIPEAAMSVHIKATRNSSTGASSSAVKNAPHIASFELHTVCSELELYNHANDTTKSRNTIKNVVRQNSARMITGRSMAALPAANAERPGSNSNSKQSSVQGLEKSLVALPSVGILRWNVSQHSMESDGGVHDDIRGLSLVYIEKDSQALGVSAHLSGPHRVSHDFENQGGIAFVDLSLSISHELPGLLDIQWGTLGTSPVVFTDGTQANGYGDTDEDKSLVLSPAISSGSIGEGHLPVASLESPTALPQDGIQNCKYVVCGQTSGIIRGVEMGKEVKVLLKIAAREEGWMEVGKCWVSWRCRMTPQLSGSVEIPAHYVFVGK